MKSIDPKASWNRVVSAQGRPTRKRFATLFAKGNRDKIILLTVPLIRKYNRRTPQRLRDDVEAFTLIKVTEAVDELLGRDNANPGSYLIDVIRHAIHAARYGETTDAQECVPSTQRIYSPRERHSDAERDELISKLQRQGHSKAMIDAELAARGWQRSSIVTHESEWPIVPHEETGEPALADFGESPESNDEWELLEEICDDEELLILRLLSHGHTRQYVAKAIGCHESTITKTVNRIKAKVQRYEDEN